MSKETTFTMDAYRHMFEHAGYSYQPKTETPDQGRVRCALALARAEFEASRVGAFCQWQDEPDPDTSWMDAEARHEYNAGESVMMYCILYGPDGEVRGSLGDIHMLSPWQSQAYRRVVEAELALEANICHPLDRNIA